MANIGPFIKKNCAMIRAHNEATTMKARSYIIISTTMYVVIMDLVDMISVVVLA